jgi:uncharacterized membrane protein YdbT with pleckstrin-like domain
LHWIVYGPLVGLVFAGWFFGQAFDTAGLFWTSLVVAVFGAPFVAIYRRTSEFAVTNRRFIGKTGFISRKTVETALHKIEVLSVEQGITARMLGYGTVIVTGTGGTPNEFKHVDDPLDVRKAVYEQLGKNSADEGANKATDDQQEEDLISRLERLAALRRDGILNEREFEEQKKRLMEG